MLFRVIEQYIFVFCACTVDDSRRAFLAPIKLAYNPSTVTQNHVLSEKKKFFKQRLFLIGLSDNPVILNVRPMKYESKMPSK